MAERLPAIDADGHIVEREQDIRKYLQPPWDRRSGPLGPLDQPWDHSLFGRHGFANPDYQPVPGVSYRAGMSPEEQVEAWERIMDREGVEATICFPTSSGRVALLRERDFQVAVARATNDHFAKEYQGRSDRIRCMGVLPLAFPDEAAKELRRAATELGLIGFELVSCATLPHAYGSSFYDPIFAEAERLGVVLAIHGTRVNSHDVGAASLTTFSAVHTYAFPAGLMLHFTSIIYEGLPIRFPKLKLAFLEIGATWLPYYLDRMDEHWEKRGDIEMPLLRQKPSELVRNAPIWFSIESGESLLPQTIEYLGDQHFLYASDIPHWDNEFPKSLNQLRQHPDLSQETKERILYHNARELFGLGAPSRVSAAQT